MKNINKYKVEFGLWEPKGNLVSTVYNQNTGLNTVKSMDVSLDSRYFITTSARNVNVWNTDNLTDITSAFNIHCSQNLTCCSMLDSSYSFVVGGEKGYLDLYSPFEFEDKTCGNSSHDPRLKSCYIMHRISHPDEGAIIDCKNKIFEAEREH